MTLLLLAALGMAGLDAAAGLSLHRAMADSADGMAEGHDDCAECGDHDSGDGDDAHGNTTTTTTTTSRCRHDCYCCWGAETLCGGDGDDDDDDCQHEQDKEYETEDGAKHGNEGVEKQLNGHGETVMMAAAAKSPPPPPTTTTQKSSQPYYYGKGTVLLQAKKTV